MHPVDFELSDDQVALQDAARDLLDALAGHDQRRAHLTSGEPFDHALFSAMVDQGWLGIALSEEKGGIGLGWVEAAVLLEQIGAHAAPVPFLPSLLALTVLDRSDNAPESWITALVNGERTGCVAWSKNADALSSTSDGAAWTISGRIGVLEGATHADIAVVTTRDGVFGVELTSSTRPQRESAMDETRGLSWLEFDKTSALRLGGAELAETLLNHGAVGASAEMLGGANQVMDISVQYAKDRVQFGQPIGSFQAIKHRCADMVVDVEGMRSATWYAAWALSVGDSEASLAASTAKVWSSDASKRVMASGLQVHGGIGFTWEHDLHLYMKRAQFDQLSYGTASFHRERVALLLRSQLASGAGVF